MARSDQSIVPEVATNVGSDNFPIDAVAGNKILIRTAGRAWCTTCAGLRGSAASYLSRHGSVWLCNGKKGEGLEERTKTTFLRWI